MQKKREQIYLYFFDVSFYYFMLSLTTQNAKKLDIHCYSHQVKNNFFV